MRPIIEKIVDPVQTAFVPKRSIHDNILLAHEIMNKFQNMKGKKSWVDMEKAYNRVEWAFLFQMLIVLGFHSKWVELIKECVTIVSYLIIVNDDVYGFFKPTRGIRQGDPLSPYLFLFCMEVLTRQLRQAQLKKKTSIGVKIALTVVKIPCLLFANDSLIFCRTNLESCQLLNELLLKFLPKRGAAHKFFTSPLQPSPRIPRLMTRISSPFSSILNIKTI